MRIAYVTPHFSPFIGGVEHHVLQIATRVAGQGHNVTVLTHQEPNPLPAVETLGAVTVRRFPVPVASTNFAMSPALCRHLVRAKNEYDLVHAHSYHALPALAARVFKQTPLVFTPHYHGTGHSSFRALLHRPYRRVGAKIFEGSDAIIAVSPAEAELIRTHFPPVSSRIHVIPNGVDARALAAANSFATDEVVILSAGRLEPYKQVDRTVASLRSLPDRFVLRVTGDGPARSAIADAVEIAALGGRVHLVGRVPEDVLHRWYKTASVYVTMSRHEAMGITIAEALAAGTRVVASDIPAHRSVQRSAGGTMRLVAVDASPAQLAEAIQDIVDAPVRPAMVETWDDVSERTARLYEDVARPRICG